MTERPSAPCLLGPWWAQAILGWLVASTWLAARPSSTPSPPAECTLEDEPFPDTAPGPGALREIEGLGRSLSLRLARSFWESALPRRDVAGWLPRVSGFDPDDVRGIGPITTERIERWLDERAHARAPVRGSARQRVHSELPTMVKPPLPASGLPRPRIGLPPPLDGAGLDAVIERALDEDRGAGDITSQACVPEGTRARARLVSRAHGVLAGRDVFTRVFRRVDPGVAVDWHRADGARIVPDEELARLEGDARSLLLAERTALNLLQRMSGIATATARFVESACAASGGRDVRILDTRKTTPGLRALEKYAVRCGGGENHRFGLWDEVLVKENHLALAKRAMDALLADVRAAVGPAVRVTVEARDADEALTAVEGGADVVLLDNMDSEAMAELCPRLRARAAGRARALEIEASGGVDGESLARIAASGVDRVSVGALTHSSPALDLSLYMEPLP